MTWTMAEIQYTSFLFTINLFSVTNFLVLLKLHFLDWLEKSINLGYRTDKTVQRKPPPPLSYPPLGAEEGALGPPDHSVTARGKGP